MAKQGLDGWAIRNAVRIARRLEFSEREIRSLVYVVMESYGDTRGSTISAGARMLAVVRTFETLLLAGLDREAALTQIKRRAATHLNPAIVGELLTVVRQEALAGLQGPSRSVA